MTDLPPLRCFTDIPVVPGSDMSRHVACGGPIWPEFSSQTGLRQCRDGAPVDRMPELAAKMRPLRRAAVWGGALDTQFGHLIAEHLTRLPQALRDRPDDLYLFTTKPSDSEDSLPAWVWDILDWHGVPRRKIRIISQALLVSELHVAEQGEMLGQIPTSPAYLDLMDANTARQKLEPDPAPVLFVGRPGMVARGMGGHAGEAYLMQVLAEAGLRVIDPVGLTIRRQMELYAGARALVFAEGSALHGRQLLGRLAQDIHVLRRRPHQDIGKNQIAPRCRKLTYHPATGARLGVRMPYGGNRKDLSAALYDMDAVFDLFGPLGHDLRPYWDKAAYRAAVEADLRGWLAACRTAPDQLLDNLATISQAGFAIDAPLTYAEAQPGLAPH